MKIYVPKPTQDMGDIAENMARLANKFKETIVCEYNEILLVAREGYSARKILAPIKRKSNKMRKY
jgi:hypothetical protein